MSFLASEGHVKSTHVITRIVARGVGGMEDRSTAVVSRDLCHYMDVLPVQYFCAGDLRRTTSY